MRLNSHHRSFTKRPAPQMRCRSFVAPSVKPGGIAAMGSHLPRRAAPAREATTREQIFAIGEIPVLFYVTVF